MTKISIRNSTVGQLNDSGDNISINSGGNKSQSSHPLGLVTFICTLIGGIAGLVSWYIAHLEYGVWFFWL